MATVKRLGDLQAQALRRLLATGGVGELALPASSRASLVSRGLVTEQGDGVYLITPAGRMALQQYERPR